MEITETQASKELTIYKTNIRHTGEKKKKFLPYKTTIVKSVCGGRERSGKFNTHFTSMSHLFTLRKNVDEMSALHVLVSSK